MTSGNIWAVAAELLGTPKNIGRLFGNAMGVVQYCKANKKFIERGRTPFPKPDKEIIRIFLQWGLNQLEQGRAEIKRVAAFKKKQFERFAWDTSFLSSPVFAVSLITLVLQVNRTTR